MTGPPAPLTPPDCDLRSVPSMLLDVQRFRDSDLVVLEKAEAVVAAILLWGAAWHQVPAASLPDDDRMLAQLAGYGKVVNAWKKVKAGALRGFVKCSDGRLYHPVVAEKAIGMWEDKLKRRHNTLLAAIRKHNERHPNDQLVAPSFDEWNARGRPERISDLPNTSREHHADVTRDNAPMSQGQPPNVARETASNRTELNRTELNQKPKPSPTESTKPLKLSLAREKPPPGITDAATAFNYVCLEADWRPANDTQRQNGLGIVSGWLALGCTLELILDGIAQARKRDPSATRSLKRFDSTIRGKRRDQIGEDLPPTKAEVAGIAGNLASNVRVN